jgi:hypothetical protein
MVPSVGLGNFALEFEVDKQGTWTSVDLAQTRWHKETKLPSVSFLEMGADLSEEVWALSKWGLGR